MRKKILVAFDDSENAMRAVKYVAASFSPQHAVTLYSVLPDTASLCELEGSELTPYFKSQQQAFCALEEKKKTMVSQALDRAREILLAAGFPGDQISTKVEPKKKGIARDIVIEARNGYDLIVLGRRGISGIKEYFLGSISQKILHLAKESSILVVN